MKKPWGPQHPSINLAGESYKGDVYRLSGYCKNCGWEGSAWQKFGQGAPNLPQTCPECGCREVTIGHARGKSWGVV